MIKDDKMIVVNRRGTFYYPYTQLKNKKVFYETRVYPENGAKECKRRVRQMLKQKKGTQ